MTLALRQEIDQLAPPQPEFPRITRIGYALPGTNELVQLILHRDHPLAPGYTIVRMFRRPMGFKIYSVSNDGQNGLLNFLSQVGISDEHMSPQILIQEISACEAGEDDKEEDPDAPDDDPDDPDAPDGSDRPTPVPVTTSDPTVS